VELEKVESGDDIGELLNLVTLHHEYTESAVAERILAKWPDVLRHFIKVMPTDYKRVLAERKKHDEEIEALVHTEGRMYDENGVNGEAANGESGNGIAITSEAPSKLGG
jgi:hypothetical protein